MIDRAVRRTIDLADRYQAAILVISLAMLEQRAFWSWLIAVKMQLYSDDNICDRTQHVKAHETARMVKIMKYIHDEYWRKLKK